MKFAQVILFPWRRQSDAGFRSDGCSLRPNHFLADFLNLRFLRHRKNRFAAKLKTGLVRLPVHQPLAFDAADRRNGAVGIADAKRNAVIVAEIELGKVAVQMLLGTVLIDATHAALEDREVAFR